jgi:uncharacterized membrane-anchored protein YjiN (DUF445 family)
MNPEQASAREPSARGSQRLATGLLGLMTLLYVLARLAPPSWTAAPWVGAFGEAGMVGAIADWFAVTALFRRPFGLPIPHTAIIPRNRDKLARALGDFLADNFLEPRLLDRKVVDFAPAERLARLLADPARVTLISRRAAAAAPEVLGVGPAAADLVASIATRLVRAGPLAPVAGRILRYLWRETAAPVLVDRAVIALRNYVAEHPQLVESAVEARTWRWAPRWLDHALAERVIQGLLQTLEEMRDTAHPLRQAIDDQVEGFITRLLDDPDYLARGEVLKARLLADPGLLPALIQALSTGARRLAAEPQGVRDLIEETLSKGLLAAGAWLSRDAAARERLDLWVRIALRRSLGPGRAAIGAFVTQVVSGWDARDVADRLERQVGRDLQFIRVNGALVGALVGLLIHALSRGLA